MAKTERIPQCDIYDLPDFPSRRTAPYLIQQLARLMAADYHARVAATGVAPAQAYVLRELWRNAPLSQVEISERLDIGKATVGQSLKRLERAGFIERRRNPDDGRKGAGGKIYDIAYHFFRARRLAGELGWRRDAGYSKLADY